jgi:hypothetical protein
MATLEQLQNALVKADAAGNVEDARAFANEIRSMQAAAPVAKPAEKPQSFLSSVGDTLGNIGAGAIRGAGSIGATILTPIDAAARAMGIENDYIGRTDRREAMDYALQDMGADPKSMAYQGGKLGAEIAGTSGAGKILAAGASKIPMFAKNAPLIQSLRTGGMANAPLATRVAGGATVGGATAAAVNPNDVGFGAFVGGSLPVAGAAVRGLGNVASKVVGQTTGAGDSALQQALRAGRAGGDTAKTFTKNMRGGADMTDVLDVAKSNLAEMNAAKQAAYRADMNAIKTDKTVLSFNGIDNSVNNALNKVTFKGQVKNEGAANYLGKAQAEIDNWKNLDPAEFHSAEGLDALKQKVGDILESIPFEQKTARSAVGDVYNGIKTEIKTQAPKYADTMKAYQEASELTKEIERALSLGNRASADTSMRKLQSLMRNNVSTNYGNRLDLAGKLEAGGGQEIMPALAGQSLNSFTPRGLQGVAATGLGGFGLANPATLAALPLTSPRLMGEAAYGLGKMTRPNAMASALRQGAYRGGPVMAAGDQ